MTTAYVGAGDRCPIRGLQAFAGNSAERSLGKGHSADMMKWGRLIGRISQRSILGKRLAPSDTCCRSGGATRLPIFRSFESVASESLRVIGHEHSQRLSALSSLNSAFKLTVRMPARRSSRVVAQLDSLALGCAMEVKTHESST